MRGLIIKLVKKCFSAPSKARAYVGRARKLLQNLEVVFPMGEFNAPSGKGLTRALVEVKSNWVPAIHACTICGQLSTDLFRMASRTLRKNGRRERYLVFFL